MDRPLPADLQLQLETELAAFTALDEAEGVASDYLRFCADLARFQARARAIIRGASRGVSRGISREVSRAVDAGRARNASARRLSRDAIAFDAVLLPRLLGDLHALSRTSVTENDALARLAAASASDPQLLSDLVAAVAFGDEGAGGLHALGARAGVSSAALALIGRLLASPFLAEARHRRGVLPELDAREFETSDAVHCPSCAAAPTLAALDATDGRRRLFCSLCGETWIAPRVLCPFCGSRAGLATLRPGPREPRWIETCDACGRYVKTVDLRRVAEPGVMLPDVELAATVHLDVMAEEAGYSSLPREEITNGSLH